MEYIDVTLCLEGKMTYYHNGEKIVLHSGDAIVFPVGSERMRVRSDSRVSYASFNVFCQNFDGDNLSGFVGGALSKRNTYLVELFFEEWKTLSPLRQDKCAAIFSYIYSVLLEVSRDKENQHVKRIKRYVEENLTSDISLNDVAELLHFAPQYVCLLFKKNTGVTLLEYVNSQKIDMAIKTILTSDLPLYEIAEKCGFSNYNYFSNLFKRYTGSSPAVYRKMLKN
jgi:AraC-like DNA-binding protein